MKRLNIVLVGNISRTCAVTGAALHLIKPYGFEITDRQLKRAGLDYWDKLEVYEYENLDEFYERNSGGSFYYFTTKGKNLYSDISYPDNSFILFGREDKGLDETLLYNNKESCVRIPMRPELRSLNLSNSVAIAVYEILRQWDFPDLNREGSLTKYTW